MTDPGLDHALQRYFCPLSSLEMCQPPPKHGITLEAEAMRPCRPGVTSAPMATVKAGEELFVSWMGNGHVNNGQSDGSCVRLMLADHTSDPDFDKFRPIPDGDCIEYWHWDAQRTTPETNTLIRIPANTPAGKHTLLWYWNFTDFWYSSCADIEVFPQGSELPTTTADNRSPMSTSSAQSSELPTTTANTRYPISTSSPDPYPPSLTDMQISAYLNWGCTNSTVGEDFCLVYIGSGSYCKAWNPDSCGRSMCHQGDFLLPCSAAHAPIPNSPPLREETSPEPEPEAEPTPAPTMPPLGGELAAYRAQGCAGLSQPDIFCHEQVSASSYCKSWKKDECGRAVCQGGTHEDLNRCDGGRLRRLDAVMV